MWLFKRQSLIGLVSITLYNLELTALLNAGATKHETNNRLKKNDVFFSQ